MKNKKKKIVSLLLCAVTMVLALSGCSGGGMNDEDFQAQQLTEIKYGEGDIYYQESPYAIYSGDENLDSLLQNGMYYILHDGYYYPVIYDWTNTSEYKLEMGSKPSPGGRKAVFDSSSIVNIPTLFEGDKLFYYSTSGYYDYTTLERYKVLGWSIGLSNLQISPMGNIYFQLGEELEDSITSGTILTSELFGLYDIYQDESKASNGQFLLDKVGGVEIDESNIEDNILVGLEKGKEYNLEIYSGTEYYYYAATASVYYLDSYETYGIWENIPNQDNLYEIVVPDYLLTGYYDVGGCGFMRLVRGDHYNDETDYNEQLLYPYYETNGKETEEQLLEIEKEAAKEAGMYSEHEVLNTFVAMDNTCFGWVETDEYGNEILDGEDVEGDGVAMDQFYEASTTRTSIWLPEGKKCVISIATTETTGYLYLEYASGTQRKIPYDRLLGGYVLEINGSNEKADVVVKGLYNDYKIKLTNASQYNGQDANFTIEETENDDVGSNFGDVSNEMNEESN